MEGQFEKYVNLIRKMAHRYSSKLGLDYEDVEAEGFLIYCECLKKYDINKEARFSTYLCSELRRLGDCEYKLFKGRKLFTDIVADDEELNLDELGHKQNIYDELEQHDKKQFLEYSSEYLSDDAYKILEWILNRSWDKKGRRIPKIKNVVQTFHINKKVALELWDEIRRYWNNEGLCFYC